ncbi:hypothetical protein PIB30_088494 [Stylosanthes scabra]|uniref:RRM domain-containing protein n=1 Tax=Stylosanthes scabra TaxID=79078 RepID=A0ABU6RTM0_9FABA|nr:hypothetical protein [Stylosanthes scabra]
MSAGVRIVEVSEREIHGERSGYAGVRRGRKEVGLYPVFKVVTKRELYKEFEKDGYITDVIVSRKKRKKTMSLFAFIRYNSYGGAMRTIDRLNEEWKGTRKNECRDIGPHKCLITFDSPKIKDEAFQSKLLNETFDEIRLC